MFHLGINPWTTLQVFLNGWCLDRKFLENNNFQNVTNREVLEKQVAPVVLHVEEKTKDKHHVHQAKDIVTLICFVVCFVD